MKKLAETIFLSAEMHPNRVGERITALRETLRLSKAQFADSIGFDRSTLSKIENGSRGLDIAVAARIADIYGAGLDYIYRGVMADVPPDLRATILATIHAIRTSKIFGGTSSEIS